MRGGRREHVVSLGRWRPSLCMFRGDAGTRIGPEDQHALECHGDRCRRIATPFSHHLHNEIINDGLCAVASRLAPVLLAVAVCSAEVFGGEEQIRRGPMGGQAELPPTRGCYPEALPALWVVSTATGSFVGMENVSCVTVVQDSDGRSSLTQLACWGTHLGPSPAIVCYRCSCKTGSRVFNSLKLSSCSFDALWGTTRGP